MIRIWFSFQAVADANRQKAVLEIKIQENIIEVEGKKNVSQINNEILEVFVQLLFIPTETMISFTQFPQPISTFQAAEKNKADIEKYKLQQQAEANEALYSDK